MSDDLIKRLREDAGVAREQNRTIDAGDLGEAADALERLQRERDQLRREQDVAIERAEKAEAELARLTPTEEEKKNAEWCLTFYPGAGVVAALLRKFVLRETANERRSD